jgi:hypothetical protein
VTDSDLLLTATVCLCGLAGVALLLTAAFSGPTQ